jgi:hypothetical protein
MKQQKARKQLAPMDYIAIVGAGINALVICYIIGYWLLH